MNERILELAKQVWPDPNISHVNHLKFAELIVREHIAIIKRVGILEDIENETDMVVDAVKEHFGVK